MGHKHDPLGEDVRILMLHMESMKKANNLRLSSALARAVVVLTATKIAAASNRPNGLMHCPFCGGRAEMGTVHSSTNTGPIYHYVGCIRCDARTPQNLDYERARETWNRRV